MCLMMCMLMRLFVKDRCCSIWLWRKFLMAVSSVEGGGR